MMATLVIGYGNTLRGDDAVGRLAADTVEAWRLRDVKTLSVHQLTPELAEDIAAAQQVIFIDAAANASWQPLTPATSARSLTHHVDPQGLLALASALYGAMPTAYLLTLPAIDFDSRDFDIKTVNLKKANSPESPEFLSQPTLSTVAQAGLQSGLAQLYAFLAREEPDSEHGRRSD